MPRKRRHRGDETARFETCIAGTRIITGLMTECSANVAYFYPSVSTGMTKVATKWWIIRAAEA